MSEQRFIRNIMGNIYDSKTDKWFEEDWKGKPLDYDDDLIVFLNEQQATISTLKEENEEYAKIIEQFKRYEDGLWVRFTKLEKENEQLRQQHQRLYNYFRDYLEDEMSADNFSEMWDNVKEDERWNDE